MKTIAHMTNDELIAAVEACDLAMKSIDSAPRFDQMVARYTKLANEVIRRGLV